MRLRITCRRFKSAVDSEGTDISISYLSLVRKKYRYNCEIRPSLVINFDQEGSLYHFLWLYNKKKCIFNAPLYILKSFMYSNLSSFCYVVFSDRFPICKKLLIEFIKMNKLSMKTTDIYYKISMKIRGMIIGTEMSIYKDDLDIINSLMIREKELDKKIKLKEGGRVIIRSILQKGVIIYRIVNGERIDVTDEYIN